MSTYRHFTVETHLEAVSDARTVTYVTGKEFKERGPAIRCYNALAEIVTDSGPLIEVRIWAARVLVSAYGRGSEGQFKRLV